MTEEEIRDLFKMKKANIFCTITWQYADILGLLVKNVPPAFDRLNGYQFVALKEITREQIEEIAERFKKITFGVDNNWDFTMLEICEKVIGESLVNCLRADTMKEAEEYWSKYQYERSQRGNDNPII